MSKFAIGGLVLSLLVAAGCGTDEGKGRDGAGGQGGSAGVGGTAGGGEGGTAGHGEGGTAGNGQGGDGEGGSAGSGEGEGGTGGEACVPSVSCASAEASCGTVDDGCGNPLDCGSCGENQACEQNHCVCVPSVSCESAGATCGTIDDGCGNPLDCGSCGENEACEANHCACVPSVTCESVGANCGTVDDGCGNPLDCGVCTAPETCGGTGTGNVCGCTATLTCETAGASCGTVVDDCGQTLHCGTCAAPESCGGAGVDNQCGCTPSVTCETAGAECGAIDNGCGQPLDCGSCNAPEVCGADHNCACTPTVTCASEGAQCGSIVDDCGNTVECGSCGAGEICGPDNACACPLESDEDICARIGATCGPVQVADACGSLRTIASCGTCAPGLVCGGDGTPSACTPGPIWSWELPTMGDELLAVQPTGNGEAWVVGKGGAIGHYVGASLVSWPAITRAELRDVWASTANDVWAVGAKGTLLHFDGLFWSQVYSGIGGEFVSISGVASDDLWIAGSDVNGSFLVHRTANGFTRYDATGLASGETLTRVRAAAPGTVWASGSAGSTLQWNGAAWTAQNAGFGASVAALSVGTSGDAWAASGTDVRHWDGSAWNSIPAASGWLSSRRATDLWTDPTTTEPWLLLGGTSVEEVYRYSSTGIGWVGTNLPFTGTRAIRGSAAGEVWVVGTQARIARGYDAPLPVTFADLSPATISCSLVTAAGTDAWAVCGRQVFARSASGTWTALPDAPLPTTDVKAIWASGPNDVWILKNYSFAGHMIHWDGAAWTDVRTMADQYNWITGIGNRLYAAGPSGKVAIYDGTTWSVPTAKISDALFAVTAAGNKVWAVGNLGNGVYFDGTAWARSAPHNTAQRAVHAYDVDNVWSVGDVGTTSRWNGTGWTRISAGTNKNLVNVFVESPTSVWAVASDATLFHWNGTAWAQATASEQSQGAKAIVGLSNGKLLSVGAGIMLGR